MHESSQWCLCVIDTRKEKIFFFDPRGYVGRATHFLQRIITCLGQEYPLDTWEVIEVDSRKLYSYEHSFGDCVPFICKAAYCFAAGKYPPPLYFDRLDYYRHEMILEILAKTLSPISLSI